MTVATLANVTTGALNRTLGNNTTKYAESVKALLAKSGATAVTGDLSALSTAAALQTQISGLRTASINIAQNAGQVEVAAQGIAKINRALADLENAATEGTSESLSSEQRAKLDETIRSALADIDNAVQNSRFAGKPVLDGSISAASLGLEGDEGLPDLSVRALFTDNDLTANSSESAQRALESIKEAISVFNAGVENVVNIANALDYAAASVETALQNQDAARSSLSDIANIIPDKPEDQVKYQPSLSLLAQTNRLPSSILQILSE